MQKRFVYGPIMLAAVLGLFWADYRELLSSTRPCISVLIALVGSVCWFEFAQMSGLMGRGERGDVVLFLFGLAAVLFYHAVAWYEAIHRPMQTPGHAVDLEVAGTAGLVVGAFLLVVVRRDFLRHYISVLETVVGALIFGLLLSYLTRIYQIRPNGVELGVLYLLGIKGTDVTAYLVGCTVGKRHILAVSPKKTLEGCLGALVWGAIWFAVAPRAFDTPPFSWWPGVVFGIILAAVAQVGDLSASLLKREYQTKDSQSLIPEFGGVLDLIDSLLFTGYLFWCFVHFWGGQGS